MIKKIRKILLVIILFFIIGEIILRVGFGFGDAVLVKEDPYTEYMAQPNQERSRFGSKIYYNQYSMRSYPLLPKSVKILGLGDSVINGGTLTDQEELATTMLSQELSKQMNQEIQVLNISYGSWGPDNVYAYLKHYGHFDAEVMFLVVSSHDAFDNMNFEKIVDKNVSYPSKQYSLAYVELIDRYVLSKFGKDTDNQKNNELGIAKDGNTFNTGFKNILEYSLEHEIPFFIYLHPEKSEVKMGHYNKQGGLIIDFAKKHHIVLLQGIEKANEDHYRDKIHLNEKGQKYLYRRLLPVIKKIVER